MRWPSNTISISIWTLLSIFPFWPAFLALTAAAIIVSTIFLQATLADQLPLAITVFHLLAYAFFTMLWIRYMSCFLPVKAPQSRWLIGALALPVGFLLGTQLFFAIAAEGFAAQNLIVSAAAIIAVVGVIFLKALFSKT